MPLWLIILLIAVAVIAIFLVFTYNGLVRAPQPGRRGVEPDQRAAEAPA